LNSGTTVVLDRFWWSTWVYGLASGVPEPVIRRMLRVESAFWGKVRPTAVFLLNRDGPVASIPPNVTRLQHLYAQLRRKEAGKYPIHAVSNDASVQATVERLLAHCDHRVRGSPHIVSRPGHAKPLPAQDLRPLGLQPDLFTNRGHASAPTIIVAETPPVKTVVFDTYWRFAAERQAIYFRRVSGAKRPWTDDPILSEYKFTNAYRAADRVSQYLIREVLYSGEPSPSEVFFRAVLFKFFNKIETWELLRNAFGSITYSSFDVDRYDRVLRDAQRGRSIYSAAYIMPTGGRAFPRGPKHRMHLDLLKRMMDDELPLRIFDARSLQDVFQLLRSYPTIGDFLAYQYATDLNYSPLMNHSEADFVVPGPGARDGIRKCFSDLGSFDENGVIRYMADRQEREFLRLGLSFQDLWGRPLQLIDCQNLFCEVDKYSRVRHPDVAGRTGRTRIKQRFAPEGELPRPWFPPKWGLNERIQVELSRKPPASSA
jgi:hypothetical protein